ncbi:MAG: hypothetical protein O9267_05320 [Flavobacterium sp.]|uniref:hypothetical protein n=1 Tax=Flavobacterium sp. TaxID=239 RepID=UPI0022C01EDF|nr:hypothetical protein [Flavobacterium sp.]MCZ8197004.1 hypothetical protein [Flavobacterium sp.]
MDIEVKTYSTLYNLVEADENEHELKKLAILFLEAMNDWPAFNQDFISEYLQELKDYFGFPITLEKIDSKNKVFDGKNGWKIESGSSIAEMIEFSKLFLNEIEFEVIIQNILNYYNNEFKKVDFIAELKYLATEQNGRKTFAKSGYRPQIKFNFSEQQTSGIQTFIDKEIVMPGENVLAKIKILSPNFFANLLKEEMNFEFNEGSKLIGTGKIKYIINDKLEYKASC